MKTMIKSVSVGILMFTFFYLLGSFYNATLDVSIWSENSRLAISIFGGTFSFLAATSYALYISFESI